MDGLDARNIEECVLDSWVAHTHWGGLHDDCHGVLQDADGGGKNQKAEDECTNGVNNNPIWLEVDDQSSNEDTLEKTFHTSYILLNSFT